MDDNKILTLINGDRIPLTSTMSLLFEIEDMEVASPATVSRAGMIYMDVTEMGWQPFKETWLNTHFGESGTRARNIHNFVKTHEYSTELSPKLNRRHRIHY